MVRLVLSTTVMLLAAPVLAAPLDRTEPGHLPPVPPGGYDLPMSPPVVPYPLPPQWAIIKSSQEWRNAGKFEKDLSRDCAARRFREITPMRFRALYQGEVLGVAFGHGLNLYDPKKLADRKLIYLFRDGDSTRCTVLSMMNSDPRVLDNPASQTPGKPASSSPKRY